MITKLNDRQVNILLSGYADEVVDFNNNKPQWRIDGDITPLMDENRVRVAIVGTRDLKGGDAAAIIELVEDLAANPAKPVIISGLAVGTDTVAHKAALAYGLPTFAVMPCGLDTVYPHMNANLADKMKENGGGLLSYFPEGTAPMAINFLHRNKAIALMADVLIIPFSKKKGGAMVTARLASAYGNSHVFAFPGRPCDINCQGCNELIREGLAEIVSEPHIFRDYHLVPRPRN